MAILTGVENDIFATAIKHLNELEPRSQRFVVVTLAQSLSDAPPPWPLFVDHNTRWSPPLNDTENTVLRAITSAMNGRLDTKGIARVAGKLDETVFERPRPHWPLFSAARAEL